MGGFVLYLGNYVVYIRVWEGLFSIWVIMLYRIRVWEGLFSI